MTSIKNCVLLMAMVYGVQLFAQKGAVFTPEKDLGQQIISKNQVSFLHSQHPTSSVAVSLQAHPFESNNLHLEVVIESNLANGPIEFSPEDIVLEVTEKGDITHYTCDNPVMIARLFEGMKAVARNNAMLKKERIAAGDSIAEITKSKIRMAAEKNANPTTFGLLSKSVFSNNLKKTGGLVIYPMIGKKCSKVVVKVPLGNDIHHFTFHVNSGKNISMPMSPLINHYFSQQAPGAETPANGSMAIIKEALDL